jgi:hypothetical protein
MRYIHWVRLVVPYEEDRGLSIPLSEDRTIIHNDPPKESDNSTLDAVFAYILDNDHLVMADIDANGDTVYA